MLREPQHERRIVCVSKSPFVLRLRRRTPRELFGQIHQFITRSHESYRCSRQSIGNEMQRGGGFIVAILVMFVFVSVPIAQSASVNDPAWEKIVTAGKKESKVVVFGPPGPDVRDAFTLGFQKNIPKSRSTSTECKALKWRRSS